MINEDKLEELFNKEIKHVNPAMRINRILMHNFLLLGIASGLIYVLFILIIDTTWLRYTFAIIGFFVVIFFFAYSNAKYKQLILDYKSNVIQKLVNLINPHFSYSPDKYYSNNVDGNDCREINELNNSGIFKNVANHIKGDDTISGKVGRTPFKFTEINAFEQTKGSSGKTSLSLFFHGLFFIAEFNKNIEGKTFVFPNKSKALTNKVGSEKKNIKSYGELVKLENPEFEKIYSVYGTSQQESRYILTPAIMEAMVNIYKKHKRKMSFSFTGNFVYCTVPFSTSYFGSLINGVFEPSRKRSEPDFNEVKDIYNLLELIETIINEMNLNTRIWTKI